MEVFQVVHYESDSSFYWLCCTAFKWLCFCMCNYSHLMVIAKFLLHSQCCDEYKCKYICRIKSWKGSINKCIYFKFYLFIYMCTCWGIDVHFICVWVLVYRNAGRYVEVRRQLWLSVLIIHLAWDRVLFCSFPLWFVHQPGSWLAQELLEFLGCYVLKEVHKSP